MCIRDSRKSRDSYRKGYVEVRATLLTGGNVHRNDSVSYTHLDVYKRQALFLFGITAKEFYHTFKKTEGFIWNFALTD